MPFSYDRKILVPSDGLVNARDPSTLGDSELTVATSCEYHIGSPHMYKQPGRVVAGTLTGASQVVRAVHHLQYDSSASVIAAYGGDGILYESSVALSLSFAAKLAALTGSVVPQFNSFSDRWIMVNGVDSNYVRESVASAVEHGYHTAVTSPTVMTDSNKTTWVASQWVGATIVNVTDGSSGTITANTTTTVTATLTGGTDNDWDTNDVYKITSKWRALGMQAAVGTTSTLVNPATFELVTVHPDNGTAISPHHIYQSATTSGTVDDGRN